MLRGFLDGLAAHLTPGGEGWLILSDLAEHLGLRSRDDLLDMIARAGLRAVDRIDTRPRRAPPTHPIRCTRRARAKSPRSGGWPPPDGLTSRPAETRRPRRWRRLTRPAATFTLMAMMKTLKKKAITLCTSAVRAAGG